MKRLAVLVPLVVAMLVSSVGVTAAASKDPAGDRINLFGGDTAYPAYTAFYVSHGFTFEAGDIAVGRAVFRLEVDGVERAADFTQLYPETSSKVWVFKFPDGLSAGTHSLTGHWIVACVAGVNCGDLRPNAPIEFLTLEISVDLTT